MTRNYLFGFLVLLACFCLEAASRPSNNESSQNLKVEVPIEDLEKNKSRERVLFEDERPFDLQETKPENTKDILDKIKEINDKLKKPQRQQINFNAPPFVSGGYILDKAILEKIQKIIASGKVHGVPTQKEQPENSSSDEAKDIEAREENARALRFIQPALTSNDLSGQSVALAPMPYVTNLPVIVMPSPSTYSTSNDINSIQSDYLTRQRPSLPFQIQWPLAPFFPVLIKDPLLHYLGGGTWQTLIDVGQNADVCKRKQKSTDNETSDDEEVATENDQVEDVGLENSLNLLKMLSSRQGRKIKNVKKRTVSKTPSNLQTLIEQQTLPKASPSTYQTLQDVKNLQNLFKPTPKPTKKPAPILEPEPDTKLSPQEGDLKFTFSDFNWFGGRKPVAPSPGFFINRLKVRRGGVAIAGPGGVATAGRGGTAVVGPGGLAYTQPGGVAVAGPEARVVALSPEADLNSVVTRLRQQAASDSSVPRLIQAIPEGKVVATGPVIYYHPYTS